MKQDNLKQQREEAWIGDAVLELYARAKVLREKGGIDAGMKASFTCNAFLNGIANPTEVEARIGRRYTAGGLEAAFGWIRETLEPKFAAQHRK